MKKIMFELEKELKERILVLDGAMGTVLQKYELTIEDFNGAKGCYEILNETRPDIIFEVHKKYIEAGADIIDTAISPLSGGTSQPATESIVRAFQGTERETGFDLELLKEIAEYFKPIRAKYLQEGILNPQALMTEPSIVEYQLPGGMLSNFLSQLKMQKAENKYEDVLREIPRVRKDLGYPPLVTPLSQMVGTQAIFNILTGQRYKLIPNEIKNYVRGLYGKSPVPISDEIKKTIIFNEEVFTGRPADKLAAEYDKMVEETRDFARSEEDVLSYALFPQVAKDFLIKKYGNE
mgnify:CR=1 FL=1